MRTPIGPLGAMLLVATLAAASDVPLQGEELSLRANLVATRRSGRFVLRDPAIAPPFADPSGGAALVVSAPLAAGQCRAELPLDAAGWHELNRDGSSRGYRYRSPSPQTTGVRRVLIRPGVLKATLGGSGWPCRLDAPQLPVPVSVVLRIPGGRYCASFGGTTVVNRRGKLVMQAAPAPAACPKRDVTVADLNVLHGLFCPAETASCRLSDRLDLLYQWIVRAGCPDVVTLQEVSTQIAPLIDARRTTICPFPYEMVYTQHNPADDEVILSRFPVVAQDQTALHFNIRTVQHARIDHPVGALDVFSTHLASGSDFAGFPCTSFGQTCPAVCVAAGAITVRDCQGVQLRATVASLHDVSTPAIVTGDFNDDPTSFVYAQLTTGAGWTDSYLAAGNPECDPGTGIGCTSGRMDETLDDLESPASNEVERIDYAFVVPPGAGSLCTAQLDGAADADGDGTATRIFADDPNLFGGTCGPSPDPVCWPSDHEGAELDLDCG